MDNMAVQKDDVAHSGPVTAIQACSSRVWTAGGAAAADASLIEWGQDGTLQSVADVSQLGE